MGGGTVWVIVPRQVSALGAREPVGLPGEVTRGAPLVAQPARGEARAVVPPVDVAYKPEETVGGLDVPRGDGVARGGRWGLSPLAVAVATPPPAPLTAPLGPAPLADGRPAEAHVTPLGLGRLGPAPADTLTVTVTRRGERKGLERGTAPPVRSPGKHTTWAHGRLVVVKGVSE